MTNVIESLSNGGVTLAESSADMLGNQPQQEDEDEEDEDEEEVWEEDDEDDRERNS